MKKIFLTGAAGFIGFHLAKSLKTRGDTVIGFDNFNDYYTPVLKRKRAALLQKEGIEVVEGDLCHQDHLEELFKKHSFTHTINLAAQAGVRYSFKNPKAYVHSNLEGFVSLIEVCRKTPQNPFIYASSSSVYGANTKIPFSIEDTTDQPVNLYGATKKANELIAYSYHHLYQLPVTGLRFFTVYGPWGRPDMAYFSFTKHLLEEEPIRLFNQGKMQRDFTYIDDIVDGIVAALDLGAPCELFNLGSHRPEELNQMIAILEAATEKKAILHLEPMQPGEMEVTYADIRHSQEKLNFSPKVSLEEGLKKFVAWYQDEYTQRYSSNKK